MFVAEFLYVVVSSMSNIGTFLRGGCFINTEGIVEIINIYAGYYTGRTAHSIHTTIMAVKVGKKYPATIFRVPQLFLMPQLFLESPQLFWQGPRVQPSKSLSQGRLILGCRRLSPAHLILSPLISSPPRSATLLAPYMPSWTQNQASS